MKRHICPACHGRSIARLPGGGITECTTCFGHGWISNRDRLAFFGGVVIEAVLFLFVIWALVVVASAVPR